MFINIYYSFINRAFGSDFQVPLIGRTSVPACHHNVRRGRPTYHRGRGCVTANLHTPLSPLFRGESQKFEFPYHQEEMPHRGMIPFYGVHTPCTLMPEKPR